MTRHLLTVCNKLKTFSSEQLLYFDQPFDLQSNSVNLKAKSFVTRLRNPLLDSWSARGGYVDICRGGGGAGSAFTPIAEWIQGKRRIK